jgi:chemotaxis protein MotA
MIGTVIGLVQMLQTMSDPSTIGPAMAVALLTTLYGAILANLVFNPMAGKLKARSKEEVLLREMIMEGILSISKGENPRIIEEKLNSYLPPKDRVVTD